MSIFSYLDFLNEQRVLEGLREMVFVLSPRFMEYLNKINHVISEELIKLHNDLDASQKQTYVDICEDKDDTITFIQANKASELLNIETEEKYDKVDKELLHHVPLSSPVYKQHRSEVGLGRFVNNVFGAGTFPASSSRLYTGSKPNDVESFVRMYKASFNQEEKFELMEVVHGNKIAYWYDCNHYANEENGSMGGSCMADVNSSYFDIYCDNPGKVGLLILYKNKNRSKIKGRAIVWENLQTPSGRTYMDRIYTNDSSDEEIFMEYAKKQGWLYRNQRGYSFTSYVIDPLNNTNTIMTLTSQLGAVEHDYYPYLDTMTYYNPNSGKISNKENGMTHILSSTIGEYDETGYQDETEVWSNYEHQNIYQSQAKWCEFGQDWISTDNAIRVWNTSPTKYAVPGNPDVVRCFIPDYCDKYFEKSRCTWSNYLNTWVFNGSVVKVWTDFDRNESVIDYKKRSGVTFAEVDDEFWKIDLVKKVHDEWVLKGDVRRPVNTPRGWHNIKEFIDDEGNVFHRGRYIRKQ